MRGCWGEAPPEFSGEGGAWFTGLWVGVVCAETASCEFVWVGGEQTCVALDVAFIQYSGYSIHVRTYHGGDMHLVVVPPFVRNLLLLLLLLGPP